MKEEISEIPGAKVLPQIEGRVEFKDVSFSYGKGEKVLNDVSFKAEPGEVIAIVGPSGPRTGQPLRPNPPKGDMTLIDL